MINLPKLAALDVKGKKVFVRGDIDVPLNESANTDGTKSFTPADVSRIEAMKPTLQYLLLQEAGKIVIGGHLGRSGEGEPIVSSKILTETFSKMLNLQVGFKPDFEEGLDNFSEKVIILENLRSLPFEEKNDTEFAERLSKLADCYVNECFSTSHRNHVSIVALPKLMEKKNPASVAAGLRLEKEIEVLSKILENPQRPIILCISGIKKDKLNYVESLSKITEKILVGGRLPLYIEEMQVGLSDLSPETVSNILKLKREQKIVVADLNPDKEDITIRSIEKFEEEIKKAGTIILAGVPGRYEDPGHQLGTQRIFRAIAASGAFKLMGGGDSEAAASMFGVTESFDWISVGGGAMLEFLTNGTLPGIDVLKNE